MSESDNRKTKLPLRSALPKLTMKKSGTTEALKENKIPPVRPILRRKSKSFSSIIRTKPALPTIPLGRSVKKPETIVKKPDLVLKRSAPVETSTGTKPKQQKILPSKPAPYDYKARFLILRNEHIELKNLHTDQKKEHNELIEEVERLREQNKNLEVLQRELCSLKTDNIKKNDLINSLNAENTEQKFKLQDYEETKRKYCLLQENHILLKNECDEAKRKNKELLAENSDLRNDILKADVQRKILHNTIQDLKGKIRVYCRIRPALQSEKDKQLYTVKYSSETTFEMGLESNNRAASGKSRNGMIEFTFDKVFTPSSTQTEIFSEVGQLIDSILDGYNVCIFAYGQTGSGKTYTMEGGNTDETFGVIPRAIYLLFESQKYRNTLGWTFKIEASFLEIYNENIYDLLDDAKVQKPHDIHMTDMKGKDLYVSNLTIKQIKSAVELISWMHVSQRNRATAATEFNERSSRSHSVAKITIKGTNNITKEIFESNLNLVDLAGSEKVHSSETIRLNETKNINKSLSQLGNVILALLQNQEHVPFRNSKLTHLLMPSLSGNSKTLMLVNISQLEDCYSESLNSLRFAANVNQCRIGTVRKNKIQ